jgi:hypothetical protein
MSAEPRQGQTPEDDPNIPDEEVLYRRLSYDGGAWVTRDPITGDALRPSSGGFDPDTDGVSVFRRTLLLGQDPPLGPGDVALRSGDILESIAVADVRSLHLGVRDDLWPKDVPDPDHPRYGAHALITGLDDLGRNARTRCQRRLATAPSLELVYA